MTTDDIKAMIPQWLTADEQRRIQAMFSPTPSLEELAPILRNPKNWKRISKYYGGTEGDLLRVFDCRPLDDQTAPLCPNRPRRHKSAPLHLPQ